MNQVWQECAEIYTSTDTHTHTIRNDVCEGEREDDGGKCMIGVIENLSSLLNTLSHTSPHHTHYISLKAYEGVEGPKGLGR